VNGARRVVLSRDAARHVARTIGSRTAQSASYAAKRSAARETAHRRVARDPRDVVSVQPVALPVLVVGHQPVITDRVTQPLRVDA